MEVKGYYTDVFQGGETKMVLHSLVGVFFMSYPIETGRSWEEKQNLPRLQHGPPWISSQVIGLQIRRVRSRTCRLGEVG
ncbi:hypothetical protein GOODEAATRI_011596 [Goodea atripinnis]|uniref:Uncharacterized protein n=1 Tax=Goodea atripinnis TaxID=208336 RepID=A0ABV0NTQ3_9TELE